MFVTWVALPAVVLAHGGVEHATDKAKVTHYQKPLSPVAQEKVESDFIFASKSGERLKNMPVKLTLIDTHYGDESKDKVVLTQEDKTDANGIIQFNYRYAKPDYYDIDLDFEVDGKPQAAGFLLQIRNPYKTWYSLTYIPVILIGVGAGWLLGKTKFQKSQPRNLSDLDTKYGKVKSR